MKVYIARGARHFKPLRFTTLIALLACAVLAETVLLTTVVVVVFYTESTCIQMPPYKLYAYNQLLNSPPRDDGGAICPRGNALYPNETRAMLNLRQCDCYSFWKRRMQWDSSRTATQSRHGPLAS